jgi:hypothetical protein
MEEDLSSFMAKFANFTDEETELYFCFYISTQ